MSSRLVLVLSASFLAACGTPSVSDDAGVATGGGTASTGGGAAAGGGGVATGGGFATGGGAASGGGTALDAGVAGRELFVATTGNDSNPGTSALPFRTINKGITSAGTTEDTTVTVRAGIYVEKVVITGTGATTVAHLTLRSAPGELAIIDGTGLTPSGQQGLVDLASRSHVTIDGFEVRNFRTSNTNVPVGIQLTGTEDDVTLINNHVHDIITTNESCSGSGGNALGIAVYGDRAPQAITNLTIRNNELNAMKTGCSETMTLNGNVDGFVIEGNRVHDNDNIGIDIIGFEGTSPMAAFDQARNGVIRNNQVWNITSLNNPAYAGEQAADGIYVDGGKNVLIEGNVVHHADLGIELASEHAGKASSYVLARSNVV
jgi:Right handed beta helix region